MAKVYEVVIRPFRSRDLATAVAEAITEAQNWDRLVSNTGVAVVIRPLKLPKKLRKVVRGSNS